MASGSQLVKTAARRDPPPPHPRRWADRCGAPRGGCFQISRAEAPAPAPCEGSPDNVVHYGLSRKKIYNKKLINLKIYTHVWLCQADVYAYTWQTFQHNQRLKKLN